MTTKSATTRGSEKEQRGDAPLAALWALGLGRQDDAEVFNESDEGSFARAWWERHRERARRRGISSLSVFRSRLARAGDELQQMLENHDDLHLVPRDRLGIAARGTTSSYALVRGEISDAPAIAVVGTREVPAEHSTRVEGWVYELLRGLHVRVVSGGALGVDAIAHRVALELGLATDIVFAGGISQVGPRANDALFERALRQRGSWWTVKPPGYRPFRPDFLARNALIAARAEAVLVVRAPHRSGALSTAAHARELGVPVLAVPGAPDDEGAAGCLELLRNGAQLATGARDIVRCCPHLVQGELFSQEELSGGFGEDAGAGELTASQRRVVEVLFEGVRHIDELVGAPQLHEVDVYLELLELEMKGVIRAAEGGRYALTSLGRRRIAAATRAT